MAEGRFLSYRDITDPSAKMFHPCYFAEDLTGDEMEALRQVMETMWGFDEDVRIQRSIFTLSPARERIWLSLCGFRKNGSRTMKMEAAGPFYHHTHQLEEWAATIRRSNPTGAATIAAGCLPACRFWRWRGRSLQLRGQLERSRAGNLVDVSCPEKSTNGAESLTLRSRRISPSKIRLSTFGSSGTGNRPKTSDARSDSDDTLARANALSENLIYEIQNYGKQRLLRKWMPTLKLPKTERTCRVTDDPPKAGSGSPPAASGPFIPTPLQKAILAALAGQALKKQALADLICKGEGTVLYREGGIKELRALGLVEHKRRIGFFRPDAPPEDAIMPDETVPKVSPE